MVELAIGRNLKLDSLDFQNSHLTSPDLLNKSVLLSCWESVTELDSTLDFESDFESDSELKTFL